MALSPGSGERAASAAVGGGEAWGLKPGSQNLRCTRSGSGSRREDDGGDAKSEAFLGSRVWDWGKERRDTCPGPFVGQNGSQWEPECESETTSFVALFLKTCHEI